MAAVRALIVDDHADVRFLIRAIVAGAGPGVEVAGEAGDADEALAQLDALAPDAVVLDARMPRVDGYELAARLLERRPGLPILLCSAHVDADVRRRARAAGIRRVLAKDDYDSIPGALLELAGRA